MQRFVVFAPLSLSFVFQTISHQPGAARWGIQGIHEYQLFSKQNPNPDKILFLSIQFHYKAGEGSLKNSTTLDIVLAVGIETS